MKRRIVKIDQERCNGCGLCAQACHEGAIGMVDGKAALLRDDYCDGLGDCLPVCPTDAIAFEEREALPYDDAAVQAARQASPAARSQLAQWPAQIKLVPTNAPYFDGAHLLIAADCTAYAYAGFHDRFMQGCITVIGCPKLDAGDYAEKLTAILAQNNIRRVTIARMEVPCCGGLSHAAMQALRDCDKMIPWEVVTISTDGRILDR